MQAIKKRDNLIYLVKESERRIPRKGVGIALLLLILGFGYLLSVNLKYDAEAAREKRHASQNSSDENFPVIKSHSTDDERGITRNSPEHSDKSIFFTKSSKSASTSAVLKLWGYGIPLDKSERFTFSRIAGERGLKCQLVNMKLERILKLGYPTIFEVKDGKKQGYVAVVGVWGKKMYTDATTGRWVEKDWLIKYWSGNAYIFWKDIREIKNNLKRGDKGGDVSWLQEALSEIGYSGRGVTSYFGKDTEKSLILFQSANLLDGTGELDDPTKMILYKLTGNHETPAMVIPAN
ncbi:MAG: peptidoglycan-binding protein [Nitrospinota bacterium]|nr:peptidoglycan-binding protein [Nitrospinota bacterium]